MSGEALRGPDVTDLDTEEKAPGLHQFVATCALFYWAVTRESLDRYLAAVGVLCFVYLYMVFWLRYLRREHKHRR